MSEMLGANSTTREAVKIHSPAAKRRKNAAQAVSPGRSQVLASPERAKEQPTHTGSPDRHNEIYRSSSIACSSTSRPGRTTEAGNVARGSSAVFSISRNVGACVLT